MNSLFARFITTEIIVSVVCLVCPTAGRAGAWTLPAGDTQIISGFILSSANASFGDSGNATPVGFRKLLVGAYAEHGVSDNLTLILAPEFVSATEAFPGSLLHADDFALKVGARLLLDDSFGVLSAEASYKTAGAFDMSVSANKDSGQELELRLLYGTNFTLFGCEGYADAEIAERLIAGARPSETPIDLTVGLKVWRDYTIIAQSFNIIADGDGQRPYGYYRSHKLQLSLLQKLWKGVYLETGGFISPLGQNSLVERGVNTAIWVRF